MALSQDWCLQCLRTEHFKALAVPCFLPCSGFWLSVTWSWQWGVEASCLWPPGWGSRDRAFMFPYHRIPCRPKSPLNNLLLLELPLCKDALYWIVGGSVGCCREAALAVSGAPLQQLFPSLVLSSCQSEWALQTAAHTPPALGTQLQESRVTEALEQSLKSYL